MHSLAAYCVEVGSLKTGRFAWARHAQDDTGAPATGTEIEALVERLADDLDHNRPVALGFTAPLTVPVREDPTMLTAARAGEGNRSWSAGAGPTALATGLVEATWVLRALKERLTAEPPVFVGLGGFRALGRGLFVWEAFLDGKTRDADAADDAAAAVTAFLDRLDTLEAPEPDEPVVSLIGTALLRTGWVHDARALSEPVLVVRTSASETVGPDKPAAGGKKVRASA